MRKKCCRCGHKVDEYVLVGHKEIVCFDCWKSKDSAYPLTDIENNKKTEDDK